MHRHPSDPFGGEPAPGPAATAPLPVAPVVPVAPPRPFWRRWRFWWRALLGLAGLFVLLVLWLAITAPLSKSLRPVAPPSVTLRSSDGVAFARRGAIIATPVDVRHLPERVPQAFIAIEDRRFYSHWGIDPRGILRAAWHNLRAGGVREGGSTITQQLSKVSFLDADRTAARKLREVVIAFWLEAWLSKDEILSRYLSAVYFGDNVYGLRAAARHYFSVAPERLTLGEAAMLAGLMKAPSRLAPSTNLAGAQARQKVVIGAMADAGFIDAATAARVKPARLHLRPVANVPTGTYFADWAMPAARDRAGAVYAEQSVDTTLDSRLQRAAERAIAHAGLGGAQVALVAMRPDGEVVAMVGGRGYGASGFNRATQARRQPGSTFKLFVYLAALRSGLTPDDMVADAPITVDGWSPSNSSHRYRGPITLRQAFATSSNVAAVRLSEQVGRDKVIRAARDLGVTSPLRPDPSLALGTSGMTLLELTSAYAAVAGNAFPVAAHGLPLAERSWFDRLWDRQRHFDAGQRRMLLDLLSATVTQGTARSAALATQVFGKTGTTQDNRDAIFIGFAGDLVTGVWVGNDDNSPLHGIAGGGLPARIWRDFTAAAIGSRIPGAPRRAAVAPAATGEDRPELSIATELGTLKIGLDGDGITVTAPPDGGGRGRQAARPDDPALMPPDQRDGRPDRDDRDPPEPRPDD